MNLPEYLREISYFYTQKNIQLITADNISKRYGNLNALSNVSFSLNKGEIIGLLGVNGAGKSTLMKTLSGIISPDKGSVHIQGHALSSEPLIVKKMIGYLSEDNPLYEDMYVREYLEYIRGIYNQPKDRVGDVIELTGLKNEYKKMIRTLSKGNRQRVGIAQALINDPDFLILDEATSGLDPKQREKLNNLLKELSINKVILFSTHILQEVKELCTRVILLDKGNIVLDKNIVEINSIEDIFHTLNNENSSR